MCDSSSFWTLPPHQVKDVVGYIFNAAQAGVTAWLAWAAYKVAEQSKDATKAQRDIASNHYKISLYQIRKDKLDDLYLWLSNNKEYNFRKYNKYKLINNIISDIDIVFNTETDLLIVNNLLEDIRNSDSRVVLSQIPGMNEIVFSRIRNDSDAENQVKASNIFTDLLKEIEKIAAAYRECLKVPAQPY